MHADLRGACASFLPKMAIDCHDYPGVAEASALANHGGDAVLDGGHLAASVAQSSEQVTY